MPARCRTAVASSQQHTQREGEVHSLACLFLRICEPANREPANRRTWANGDEGQHGCNECDTTQHWDGTLAGPRNNPRLGWPAAEGGCSVLRAHPRGQPGQPELGQHGSPLRRRRRQRPVSKGKRHTSHTSPSRRAHDSINPSRRPISLTGGLSCRLLSNLC
jgi:hypothetical protein